MTQPDVQAREDPHTLTPVQVGAVSDDQEIANFRGGSRVRLAIGLLCGVAAAAGGVQLLRTMDAHQAYAQAASELERTDTEHADAFLRCALPNMQRAQLSSPNTFRGAIELASERMDKHYGKTLAKCTPLLERFEAAVKGIKAPADVGPRLTVVATSASDFSQAWTSYRTFLQRPSQEADATQVAPLIDKIASTWQSFQVARKQAQSAISARL